MRKTIVALGSVALLTVAAAAPAAAAGHEKGPNNPGAACVQDGIGFLKDNNLFLDAAQKKIDYSAVLPDLGLPEGSFLSLGKVVSLHASNPELFPWCSE